MSGFELSDYEMPAPVQCHLWQAEDLRPEAIDAALVVVETWTEGSPFSKHLCRCEACGQLYVDVWCELIDWDDGDDRTFPFYIPVKSERDMAQVKGAQPPPLALDLLSFYPRINEDPGACERLPGSAGLERRTRRRVVAQTR